MTRRNTISDSQLSLPFGSGSVRAISYPNRAIFFWFMVAVAFASFCIYIYAINTTARHIAERQALEREVSDLNAEINSLEFSYIELKNNITLDLAYAHGFTEVKSPLYVERTNSKNALSFNTTARVK